MSEAIHALHERGDIGFGPEDIAKLITGFESALAKLGITDRDDPARTQMAKLIIQLAKDAQCDPAGLAEKGERGCARL